MNQPLITTLLRELIAMRTVTDDFAANAKALEYISNFLAERGMRIHRTSHDNYGALVATVKDTKCPDVLLVGHTDVVPAPDQLFTLEERDSRYYGRGTRDMLGSVAAYMAVVDVVKDHLADYNFGIMLISDEETEDLGIIRLLEDGWRPKSVVLLDGGESWGLESLAKGALYISVQVNGKTAHGSRPWLGDSASFKLVDLLAELQRDYANHGPGTDTLNVANMTAGTTAWNQIPEAASALLDIRLTDPAHLETTKTRIGELCKKHGATYQQLVYFPVLKHDLNNRYIASFADSITKVTGKRHPTSIGYGASDACRFDELGIPCAVTYPPSGGHHSDAEYIEKQALFDLVDILQDHLDKTARIHHHSTAKQLVEA
jgi:succinyl-diaminopimelate desuccinylase